MCVRVKGEFCQSARGNWAQLVEPPGHLPKQTPQTIDLTNRACDLTHGYHVSPYCLEIDPKMDGFLLASNETHSKRRVIFGIPVKVKSRKDRL